MKARLIAPWLAVLTLAACNQQEPPGEMDWARAALARNPALEVISTDQEAGVFSVRDITTGALYKLRPQDLIAGPAPPAVMTQPAPAAAPAAPADDTAVETAAAAPGESAQPQTTETLAVQAGSGESLAEGPGYSISRGSTQDTSPATAPTLEGPGYSITREGAARPPVDAGTETLASRPGVERRSDPIICQGDRLMRIDGETIEFTGDAVIAENGCDLYISNARIRAGGVGIIARQARVHIVNSTIGGSRGSYEAAEGGHIYVARSTFTGIGRRFDGGVMTDLGGNSYESQ